MNLNEIIESIKACIREAAADTNPRRSLERLANLPALEIVALEAGIDFEALVEEALETVEPPRHQEQAEKTEEPPRHQERQEKLEEVVHGQERSAVRG